MLLGGASSVDPVSDDIARTVPLSQTRRKGFCVELDDIIFVHHFITISFAFVEVAKMGCSSSMNSH